MKRTLAILIALAMSVMMLTACGSKDGTSGTPDNSGDANQTSTGSYPGNKNITLYCGYSAGGSSDTLCRLLAAKVGEKLGTTVTVENVTGASGWVMWNQMMESTKPDGYSFFLINSPNVTTGKYDPDNTMKYDQNDFEMICNEVTDSNCLAIRVDDDRYSDWDSFAAYWKQAGSLITSASGLGITSDDATADMLVANDLGVDVDIIASGGSGDNVTFLEKEGMLPLDKGAMAKLVEYTSRLSDSQDKLSTRFNEVGEIVAEASTWARLSKKKLVTSEFIEKTLAERIERVKKYDSLYMEMIKENTLIINTDGAEVGVINGLTVLSIGDYTFGKPAKITANTYMGKNGIIDIEREIEMSGTSHSKGVLILSGYLGETFAQDFPLSLTASLCFEQLYNGVDGDSASSTELYAILSSLSDIPIKQSIAVTGSVDQKGHIQPIGGINEKIEGFYQVCKQRGLNGEHGVVMPIQNVKNLNLSDEVINSVKEGKFHIYAISSIDEGIEILTGVPAGKKRFCAFDSLEPQLI